MSHTHSADDRRTEPVQTTLACPHGDDACHGPRPYDDTLPCFDCYEAEAGLCPHGTPGCEGPQGDAFPCFKCFRRTNTARANARGEEVAR